MKEKIMIVDDHEDIREVVHVLLTNEGYQIIEAKDGKEALELLDDEIDLIILDVMMPEMNGYQVCLLMREKTNAPILFLTAKGQESDKTLGFSSGGDDYLTKPFSYNELNARVKALLRRYHVYQGKEKEISSIRKTSIIENLEVNQEHKEVKLNGKKLSLTDLEYEILDYLLLNRKQVISASQLFEAIWHENYYYGANNTIMVHIRNLRKKIEDDPQNPRIIKTVWERGIILTKRNLSLSMKIVLLLLSSAILAILCYAFFRNNVTDFYTFIETVEKPFNEKMFIKGFKEEAKNISIYSKDKNDKKELKKLLKKHDDYMNLLLYDENESYIDSSLGKILDEPVGFTPLYILKSDFEQYAFNNFFRETITFKDGEGIVYVSSMHLLKYIKYYFYCALFVSLLVFFLPTFIFIRKKVKYINILKEEVLNMSQGDLNHPMTIKSHDELSILAREVDILRTTLDSNYQNESKIKEAHQELITSLSHDLRTPLTTLRGYLDILSLHCYKDEKQMDHYLKGCIEKTEQIKDLSNKTFEYALVFEQDLLPQLETIQSEQFIYYLQENLEYLELEGFRIEKEIDICSVDLQLDLSMMKRMINNICSNILKYAKKDKPIYLEISIKQGKIKIVFENEKKKDLQKIESNKIGLKSVQKIVETHHGQLFIQDLPETFVLIITLPYN